MGEGKARPAEEDITTALVGMGFDRKTARSAVTTALAALAGRRLKGEELERELFKQALAIAGGNAGPGGGGSGPGGATGSGPGGVGNGGVGA